MTPYLVGGLKIPVSGIVDICVKHDLCLYEGNIRLYC